MPAIASKRQRFTAARRWPAFREQSNEQGELPKFTLREVGEPPSQPDQTHLFQLTFNRYDFNQLKIFS